MLNRIREVGQLVTGDAPIISHAPSNFAGSVFVENRSQQQAGLATHSRGGPPPMSAVMDGRTTGMPGGGARGQKRPLPEGPNVHNVKDGRYVTSRRGIPLCSGFQTGACGEHLQGRCPVDRSHGHQCNRCLSDQHGGDTGACSKTAPATPYTSEGASFGGHGKGKGKNKGKGKGSKGKSYKGWY